MFLFVIAVPMDLDVKAKATMLGACFLIVSTTLILLHTYHTCSVYM